jgi:hypothetical protein
MAESDRKRLLDRALALPNASEADFFGGRRPPRDADPALLKIIKDTSLRTKLIESRVAEGLQSPKGPQKIASILRVYPAFNAPPKAAKNGRATPRPASPERRGLPSVEDMEALLARLKAVESEVSHELAAQVDERIARLKATLAGASGDALEHAYRELGEALDERRRLASQVRAEAFRRVETDTSFGPRVHLRLLARP